MTENQHIEIMDKLNGLTDRLDRLNGSVLDLKLWRAYLTGAVAVIALIGLPVLGYFGTQIIKQGNQISAIIAKNK